MGTSWDRDPNPDSDPQHNLRVTNRGIAVAVFFGLLILLGLMVLVGRVEGAA